MGWLLGVFGNYNDVDVDSWKKLYHSPLNTIKNKDLYIVFGGLPETCLNSNPTPPSDSKRGWLACGVGIKTMGSQASYMSQADWATELSSDSFDPNTLDGHFAIVKWGGGGLKLFTDQLGLRNIYLSKKQDYCIFSTRLDWVARCTGSKEMDLKEFGSRWLMINQLSNNSFIKNVERLGQGGCATLSLGSCEIRNNLWHPTNANISDESASSLLQEYTVFGLRDSNHISLALSGGLDSRVLLSLLLKSSFDNWSVHSFNLNTHPDRQIAVKIAKKENVKQLLIDQHFPSPDKCIALLKEYIGQTMLAAPASGFLDLQFYSFLHNQGKKVIDGGSGEIARRRYLNALLLRGKRFLLNKDISKIIPLLRVYRAPIFNKESHHLMMAGIEEQLNNHFKTLPEVSEKNLENWLDLFAIRTRFPNFAGPEQSRSDSELVNHMPFIQPTFLRKIFHTPVRERKNGKMFRKIIKDNYPKLTRYPLVKDGVIYPYCFSTIPASIWTKVKRLLGRNYKDTQIELFLDQLSEYILDTVHSEGVKNYPLYDYPKLLQLVNAFYRGDKAVVDELNWWLAFDVWRQLLEDHHGLNV